MSKKKVVTLLMGLLLVLFLAACGSGDEDVTDTDSDADSGTEVEDTTEDEELTVADTWRDLDPEEIEGDLTVIHHRTDIADSVYPEYKAEFEEMYPNVNVEFEVLQDYGGDIMPRINTEDFGDVQYLPVQLPIADIPNFFEPMGTLEEMSNDYLGIEERAVDGNVYGIPIALTYTGVIYNQAVFDEAGVEGLPSTQEEFLEALQLVQDNTDAIPLYTNYGDAWPLDQWEGAVTTTAGDEDYYNVDRLDVPRPFDPGTPHYDHYQLMYDVAEAGLIEDDPLTTDWESSKVFMNNGEVATMVLGSWALEQIQEAGPNADDIAIMPYPNEAERTLFSMGADMNLSISKFSDNKEAAFAWVDYFIHKSGYSVEQAGGISASIDAPLPDALAEAEAEGVEFVIDTPAPDDQAGLLDEVDNESQVGLWDANEKQILIEAAIGNRPDSFDDIMTRWSDQWEDAYNNIVE